MISRQRATGTLQGLLPAARAFAVLPLVVGCGIFILWLPSRLVLLMFAGLLTIYAGLVSVGLSLLMLVLAWWLARIGGRDWTSRHWRSCGITVAFILINFPVAWGLAAGAIAIETANRVTVYNRTDRPIEAVRVTGGGCDEALGTIAPRRSASVWFRIKQGGVLVLHAEQGEQKKEATLDDYVWRNCGGTSKVTFTTDGEIEVDHRDAFDF